MPDQSRRWRGVSGFHARYFDTANWGVAKKIRMGFGLVLAVLILSGVITYIHMQRIGDGLREIVAVAEPLEEAALEMEINIAESARAVLDYVLTPNIERLAVIRDSDAGFKRFAYTFQRLAKTDEERRMGRTIAQLHAATGSVADEIVTLTDRRDKALNTFRRDALEIDRIIGDELPAAIDRGGPRAALKIESALAIEVSVDEAFGAIAGYVLRPDPAQRAGFSDAEADFQGHATKYRTTPMSAEEVRLLDRIDKRFAGMVASGRLILEKTDQLRERLENYQDYVEAMDRILDDRIQPLIDARTIRAEADAKASNAQGIAVMLIMGALAMVLAFALSRSLSRNIIGPIKILVQGTDAIGRGDFEHRIALARQGEFGQVAAAFNHMAEELERAQEALEQRNVDLERELGERKQAEEALIASERTLRERVGDLVEARSALENQGAELVQLAEDLSIARDQAEAANQTKSAFLASMSHELRTPLNAVIGFSEIIKDERFGPTGSPQYLDYAGDIYDAGKHLLALINDILDLSKVESGKGELQEEILEFPSVVQSALMLVRARAEKGGVEIERQIDHDLPFLKADERKLKQILANLLSNAVKFSSPGGRVVINVRCLADSGFAFQVTDNGIGMAPEDIPTALTPFGQVDSRLSREFEGTGLGLPLSKSLAELHGGTLDLQSQPNVGTTVTVRLPIARVVQKAPGASGLDASDKAAG